MHRYYLKIIFGLLVTILLQQQQLNVYKRKTKRPCINDLDRLFWILARKVHANWRSFLQMVQPATVIGWHRKLAAYLHTLKSQKYKTKRFTPQEVTQLIIQMDSDNPLWGAEKIRGELLKLGIRRAKLTIQRILEPGKRPTCAGYFDPTGGGARS